MAWKTGKAHNTILQGQAGVYAVASKLILYGFNPMFPAVDLGADIILDNGLRLQVKTARLTFPKCGRRNGYGGNYLGGAYGFSVRRGEWLGKTKGYGRSRKGYSEVADFFVLWGIEENRFWIVPTSIKNRTIWFGKFDHPNGSKNVSYTNTLKMNRVAQYENRWDLLDINGTVEEIVESSSTVSIEKEQI